MKGGSWFLMVVLVLSAAGCSRRTDERSVALPFDSDWVIESYLAGKESKLGARGGTGVKLAGGSMEVGFAFDPADPNKQQLEIMHELEGAHQDFGRTSDLLGAKITAVVGVPSAISTRDERNRISGLQLFCESENRDGIKARQYSIWHDVESWPISETVIYEPAMFVDQGWRDPEFRPDRVMQCGLKLALNSVATTSVSGAITMKEFRIELPTTEQRDRLKAEIWTSVANSRATDQATLSHLPALERSTSGTKILPVSLPVEASSASVVSVQTVPEPSGAGAQVRQVAVRFDQYGDSAARRSARLTLPLSSPLDVRGKKVTAWVAVGPALRGGSLRPNQMQIELEDAEGHALRGPAADVSTSGLVFDQQARETASRWMKIEAAPVTGRPLAMGSVAPEFQPSKVKKIHARFQVGKFSNVLLDEPYPLAGTLLLSEFRIEPDATQGPPLIAPSLSPPPVEKPPAPIERFVVGINLPFYQYADLGIFPYGGRDIGGFSSRPAKLQRHFALFKKNRIQVVRVFLLGDLRTGVTYDAAGKVSGLDKYALKDLDALITAASTNSVSLCPVLIDFMAADGSRDHEYGAKRWKDGEAPEVFLSPEHRTAFIENALRPIVRRLQEAERLKPNTVWAVEIANEIENARAIASERDFQQVVNFVRQVRDMIHREAPGLKVTIGSRDRRDLVTYWRDIGDVHQYHFYAKHEEEDGLPLRYPAGSLGL